MVGYGDIELVNEWVALIVCISDQFFSYVCVSSYMAIALVQ